MHAPLRLAPQPGAAARRGLERASDDELMSMLGAGASHAFDELIRRHQARAISIALRYTGGAALAQEMAQDAFVEVLKAAPDYQPRGKFGAFLFRILINRCRMEFRQRMRERRARECAPPADHEGVTGFDVALARERERRLNLATRQLSAAQRDALVSWAEGVKDKHLAGVLDIPVGTIRRRRFDAIERLREILDSEWPAAACARNPRTPPDIKARCWRASARRPPGSRRS